MKPDADHFRSTGGAQHQGAGDLPHKKAARLALPAVRGLTLIGLAQIENQLGASIGNNALRISTLER
jgi:hypothetical protein